MLSGDGAGGGGRSGTAFVLFVNMSGNQEHCLAPSDIATHEPSLWVSPAMPTLSLFHPAVPRGTAELFPEASQPDNCGNLYKPTVSFRIVLPS